jgi:uncharacterized protein with PIN domain
MVHDPPDLSDRYAAFDVDGMLGRLAKWLRILGFDAACPRSRPTAGRIFVTVRKSIAYSGAILVTGQDPLEQLRQVLEQAGVRPDPKLLLSRCLICNVPVQGVTREVVAGRVPDRIFEKTELFRQCPKCGRIYWEGSHEKRIKKRLEGLI